MSFLSEEGGSELKQLFFESAQELLQALNEEGLRLEQHADPEVIRSVRRAVHTLKGDSAACGYRELSELAHQLEDVLTPQMAASGAPLAELVLSAADVFAAMLAAYRSQTPLPPGQALRELIGKVTKGKGKAASKKKPKALAPPRWSEYEQVLLLEAARNGAKVLQISVGIDQACATRAAAYQLIRKALEELGQVLAIHPEEAASNPPETIEAALATSADENEVNRKCRIPAVVSNVQILAYTATQEPPRESSEAEPGPESDPPGPSGNGLGKNSQTDAAQKNEVAANPTASAEATLRVDSERIDAVLNLVGELIIGKSMLHQALADFDRQFPKDPLRGRFADAMAFQARVLNDLQKSVMKIRMVPVEQLFRRFPRVVRDVAKRRERDVELQTSGEDTELDKSILDVLAEPLTHLIRNAVDHGIEPVAERIAAGKPVHGTIRLNAFHQGNQVVIEVSDDGRGIDRNKVVARALASNAASAEEVAQMSEAEVLDLIFHPGLSTADEITSISGRGVGMDVVKTVLERLKGTVQIESQAGQGTTFYLKVPLTLAIIKALLFRVGEELYAVPLASVIEITRGQEADIHIVDQHEVMQLREEVLTLVRLGKLTHGKGAAAQKKVFVIVIHLGDRKFGLIVDKLVGEEELVIKALSDRLVATELVSGASILGDGTVVLILNLTAVVSRLGRTNGSAGGLQGPAMQKEAFA